MNDNKPFLTFEDQLNLFEKRGMKVKNKKIALEKLSNINYYKIKEFAQPFEKIENNNVYYTNTSFEGIIKRFYTDKNLRMYLLDAIEKVEISVKTRVGYTLGKHLGSDGYAMFNYWCNKNKYDKSYINKLEAEFNKKILKYIDNRNTSAIKEFIDHNGSEKTIPIWMIMDLLTFGDTIKMYELMSSKLRKEISDYYGLKSIVFEKYLKNLKLIRNFSAHNSKIIDISLKTLPPIRNEWKQELNEEHNGLAISIFILKFLINSINPKYGFGNIHKTLSKFIKHKNIKAKSLGFNNYKSINYLYKTNNDN